MCVVGGDLFSRIWSVYDCIYAYLLQDIYIAIAIKC